MILVVTGGAGFIGSNFLRYWRREHPEDRLICLDKLTYAGCRSSLKSLEGTENFRLVAEDICNRQAVEALWREEKPDAVVHLAAESHVDRSIRDPEETVRTNLLGTAVLLEASAAHGVRFHQVSTDEVYGDLPLDAKGAFTEESPLRPSSPYSSSKAGADLLALSYGRTYGLAVTVSRCANNYGPYQLPEKFIPRMVLRAMAGKPLPIFGDGRQMREWIHVEDHCRALEVILRKGRPGEVYNVGSGEEVENLSLARRLLNLIGKPETRLTFVADRPGHDLRYRLDWSRLETQLGWKPAISLAQGLEDTVRWYQENSWWWEPLGEDPLF